MDNTQTNDVEFVDMDIYDPTPSSSSNDNGASRAAPENDSHESNENETITKAQSESDEPANEQADSEPTTKPDSKDQTQKPKEKFGNRYEQRKQEMQAIRDEIKKEREELSRLRQPARTPEGQAKAQTEVEIVPKPKPPQYSKEDLTKWYNAAKESNDQVTMQACVDGLQSWRDHETDLKFWKIENGQTFEKFQASWNDNWNKATTKFPDLKDKNSELYKATDALARNYPEILNRKAADGQYVLAQVAALRLKVKSHDSVVGALEEQNKKLKEQLASYQKRAQPAGQGTKPNLAKPGSGGTPEERLASKLGV